MFGLWVWENTMVWVWDTKATLPIELIPTGRVGYERDKGSDEVEIDSANLIYP